MGMVYAVVGEPDDAIGLRATDHPGGGRDRERIVAALERQRERNLPSELGLVFPGRDGGPRTTANTRRQFRDAREHVVKDKVTGVPDGPQDMFAWVSPKTFRKTVATLLADEGGVEVAADQLGHTSPEITRKHYWHKQRSGPDVRHILNKLAPVSGGFKVGEQGNAPSPEAGKGA